MGLPRFVLPELLDRLPADDPDAVRIRQDLRLMNSLALTAGVMARGLAEHASEPPKVLVDLGAGDGTLMLRVAQRLSPRWRDLTLIMVDQRDVLDDETRARFKELGWNVEVAVGDVFEFLEQAKPRSASVTTSNLFLHHFPDEQLAQLLDRAARGTSLFMACEPRRAKLTLRLSQFFWLVGCHDISCYDAVTSVWAGFRGQELSALWPHKNGWQVHERTVWPFLQCFVARAGA